ncbi:hypothetical protein ARMGADRAFT_1008797 [Armillaria gallica]|uniref:Uncharacterized protein n=1 Tax=Armillaria gallica TaxID=47427 RepID=A0A2H3DT24_ARMGA|nr:hypothetical protein ARMGADRAFT_1008797 [Armillaria gallica]
MSSSEDAAIDAEEGQSTSIENKSPSQITYYYNAVSQQQFHTFNLNTSNQDFLVDLLHTKAKIKYDAHVTLAKRLEDVNTVAKELSGRVIFRNMHRHLKKSLGVVVYLVAACQALDGPFEEFLAQVTQEPVKAAIAEGTISRDEDGDETPITVQARKQYGHLIKQTMKEFRDHLTVMGFDEYTFNNHFSLAYAEAAAIIMLTTSVALAAASFYIQEATTMVRITAAVLAVLSAISKYVATFVPVVKEAKLAKEHLYQDVALFFWAWKEVQGLVSQVEQKLDAKALDFLSKFKKSYFSGVDGEEGPLFLKKKELSPDMCSRNRLLDASIPNPVAEKPKKKKKKKKKEEEAGRCITQ